ncbi:Nicastrin [Thelohanellus kitauei]|uniref:Nicastrin n=1 Tax=Thelohanellus kitauei TaxID=669202 RepID=A0A0C2MZL2_THEKT|nr:Nicastrin [Thelohanellus kitauei]
MSDSRPADQSFESQIPKGQDGNNKDNAWNPLGQNLMLKLHPYPIVLIRNKTEIDLIKNCYNERNLKNQYPKCGIKISLFMNSYSMNTEQCIRKNDIHPFFGDSAFCVAFKAKSFYSLLATENPSSSPKYIVISTKLDIRCLFRDYCTGAQSELFSITIQLSLIKLLSEDKINGSQFHILFIGFDGESWDNIGSSTFAYDLVHKEFTPIKDLAPENIEYWIELGSLGHPDSDFWIHTDPKLYNGEDKEKTDKIADLIITEFGKNNLKIQKAYNESNPTFPPCSLREIYRHGLKIPGILISDFNKNYKNK